MRMLTSALALSTVLATAAPTFAAGSGDKLDKGEQQFRQMQHGPQMSGFHRLDGPGRDGMHHTRRGPHGPRGGMDHGGPLKLAEKLSAMETAIGIRADQINVWRDFTDALQAVMQPPKPPMPQDSNAGPDAFERVAAMADDVSEKGKRAEKLKAAIEALRASLSPEQLVRAKQVEPPKPPKTDRGGHSKGGPRGFRTPEPVKR